MLSGFGRFETDFAFSMTVNMILAFLRVKLDSAEKTTGGCITQSITQSMEMKVGIE